MAFVYSSADVLRWHLLFSQTSAYTSSYRIKLTAMGLFGHVCKAELLILSVVFIKAYGALGTHLHFIKLNIYAIVS